MIALFLKAGAYPDIKNSLGQYPTHFDCRNTNNCPAYNYLRILQLIGFETKNVNFIKEINNLKDPLFLEELKTLKEFMINNHPKTSLLDFIFMNRNRASRYARNINEIFSRISKFINTSSLNIEHLFLSYGSILKFKYLRSSKRADLIEVAKDSLCSILGFRLPEMCSEMILQYFNDSQLEIFEDKKIIKIK